MEDTKIVCTKMMTRMNIKNIKKTKTIFRKSIDCNLVFLNRLVKWANFSLKMFRIYIYIYVRVYVPESLKGELDLCCLNWKIKLVRMDFLAS